MYQYALGDKLNELKKVDKTEEDIKNFIAAEGKDFTRSTVFREKYKTTLDSIVNSTGDSKDSSFIKTITSTTSLNFGDYKSPLFTLSGDSAKPSFGKENNVVLPLNFSSLSDAKEKISDKKYALDASTTGRSLSFGDVVVGKEGGTLFDDTDALMGRGYSNYQFVGTGDWLDTNNNYFCILIFSHNI